ncbi:hypothetical protein DES45_10927 [Microvirga subterranea]|uniref:Outer membrane protein with beta-barrel domain n=2 Tax=Microvirga subterranea TaxID=186651 RepID=A0A370HG00_9HYPH|nr:hypothetical protein DES45_10927 [Microvirga subterranea]
MHLWLNRLCLGAFSATVLSIACTSPTPAADLALGPVPATVAPLTVPPEWTFSVTPYGWFVGLTGSQTVRGRTLNVNASFIDIVDDTIGRGGTLIGLMADFEARKGPFSLFGDLVWTKVGVEGSHVRTRSVAPGVTGAVSRSLSLDIEMTILEVGAAYEVVRSGPLAFDVLGGARYWHQEAELSFERTATLDVTDLELAGTRAIAVSPSVNWLDPLIGARVRYAVAPGHELFLRGDVGGFGVGSRLSWQAAGGYGFDFGTYHGVTFSGVIGYRALYVDYARGEGRRRYEFDMLQHGPILGISARF